MPGHPRRDAPVGNGRYRGPRNGELHIPVSSPNEPIRNLEYYRTTSRPYRSPAWMYYLALAIAVAYYSTTNSGGPTALIGAGLCAAYAVYLYRGGRVVVWFW